MFSSYDVEVYKNEPDKRISEELQLTVKVSNAKEASIAVTDNSSGKTEERDHRAHNHSVHLTFIYADNLLNDIALIKVRNPIPIDGTFIAIASLPPAGNGDNIPEAGSVNYVVGWGCMQVGGSVVDRAQVIELRINPQEECANAFGGDLINDVTRFCAGYFQQNRGVCPGDSGSGLISFQNQTPMVVGVVSAGDKQRASSLPAKFTRVAPFVSWIRQYVG
ncbi:hypothetical protein AHF37_06154 [Paragonimus kellicotti]|nr:hypothetical protein AHF37_06154 [Paragonimus kellicotti]